MIFLKRYLVLFVLLIYISLANAASFDIEVVPIDDRIVIDEFAKFQIEIKNNRNQADEYRTATAAAYRSGLEERLPKGVRASGPVRAFRQYVSGNAVVPARFCQRRRCD